MIKLKSDTLTATILQKGACLSGLWRAGHENSLVLGSADEKAYSAELRYSGAVVGPIANRVGASRVTIAGKTWWLDPNEPPNCLHGGRLGLSERNWEVADRKDTSVTLQLSVEHGDMDLPGNRTFEVTYCIDQAATLTLTMRAVSDRDTAVNLAHHPYWNLDGAPTIADHRLQIAAETYLPVDTATLPLGKIAPVAGTAYDFRSSATIPTDCTLDANFCLARVRRTRPRPAATLKAPSGRTLEIETTEPGLQLYNGTGLLPASHALHNGHMMGPFAGVALEPQAWPDAPNNPAFPDIQVRADTEYFQQTVYRIS